MSEPQRSSLEQAWFDAPPGHALFPKHVERYDPQSALLYAPTEYEYQELTPCSDEPPSAEWVADAFQGFVKGEFGTSSSRGDCPVEPQWPGTTEIGEHVLHEFLRECETFLVYGGMVDSIIDGAGASMIDRLYALFTDSVLGNKENRRNVAQNGFASQISPLIEQQQRLRFIIPSFPFKDQNLFRTEAMPRHVDLGEVSTIVRLHALSLAMFQVHPYGADWIIISDGLAYAPILYVDSTEVLEYQRRLIELRNLLNIQGTVSVIDLSDMTHRIHSKDAGFEIFSVTTTNIRHIIKKLADENGNINEVLQVLIRGMKWNINLKHLQNQMARQDMWTILNTDSADDLALPIRDRWHAVQTLAEEAALSYAAYNLALRYHRVFDRLLPSTLRATVHPKPGQIAIPRAGEVFPWNGVAVVRGEAIGPLTIETWPLYRLIRQYPQAIPHRLLGSSFAFYYTCPLDG